MKDEKNIPRSSYTLDEILVEAKLQSGEAKKNTPQGAKRDGRRTPFDADEIVRSASHALNLGEDSQSTPPPKPPKKHSFFHRKKQKVSVDEDDVYYGLQLKSIDEYQKEYEKTIQLDRQQVLDMEEDLRRRQMLREQKQSSPIGENDLWSVSEAVLEQNAAEIRKKAAASGKPEPPQASAEGKVPEIPAEPSKEEPEDLQHAVEEDPESAAEPLETPELEETSKPIAEAKPVSEPTGSREIRLEEILRHAGLDTEDMFQPQQPAEPEFPGNRPLSPDLPEEQPPVLPTVQPGPVKEPEILPPTPAPVPKPVRELTSEEAPESSVSDGPKEPTETTEPSTETDANSETEPSVPKEEPETEEQPEVEEESETAVRETPGSVKEPVSAPPAAEGTHTPPAVKEPGGRPYPRYRVDSLPLRIVELNVFDDVLAEEAAEYGLPPIHAPEPIPFPVSDTQPDAEPLEKSPVEAPIEPIPLPLPSKQKIPPEETDPPSPADNEEAAPAKKKKKRFRMFGSDEDPASPEEIPHDTDDELDDYNQPDDAPSIQNDLAGEVRKLSLRFVVTGIFTLILIASAVLWEHSSLLPRELHSFCSGQTGLVIQLIFLFLSGLFCAPAIWNGLRGLFSLQANSDSGVAVAVLAACAENVLFLCTGIPADCRMYSAIAALALFLNVSGKLSMARRIQRNFRGLSSPGSKYAVQMFDDYNTALQLAKGCVAGEPKIAYQTKIAFPEHFLKHSYGTDPNEHISQFLAPIGFIGSLALCVATAVVTRNSNAALTAFTAAACVCVPFGGILSVSLPLARLSKISARCGSMTVGWDAVEHFSDVNAVLIDAEDLFPRGTVVLNGIQTFEGQRIDEAILGATALTKAVGGPLSGLFSQIVKSRGNVLPKVDHTVYEDGLGISGMVSDRKILVGNGELLRRHGVEAPSRDYEEKYRRSGKIPVYLASGGMLVAMFLVFYRSDRRRSMELRRLEYNGISLLVRTRDPNITPELIADCFGLSSHSISVLPERLGDIYASLRKNPPERAPALLVTKGRASSMIRILAGCVRQRSNIVIGAALQTVGAVLGFALVAFFTACSGLSHLSVTALLLFELFWTAVAVVFPRLRKP